MSSLARTLSHYLIQSKQRNVIQKLETENHFVMLQENVLWQRLSPCVKTLVIDRNLLYMCKSLKYILTEVMKHNVDFFSKITYFWNACELNISGVILK